ncbi:MAG: NfeD family protein [Chloroflexota bacterium]|nr:MAG: hypothetical protein DIU68_02190 [Chloroflexota bacterium]
MQLPFTVDPDLVYLILLLGLWSGVTAAYVPGTGIAELFSAAVSLGAIVLLTSLPTNWLAVLLLVVGVSGFLVMPFIHRRLALLAVGGLILQALGSLFLFDGMSVSVPLIAATIVISLLYHRFVLLPTLNRPLPEAVADEDDLLIGATGRVVSPLNPVGTVQAAGELWTARSDRPLESGDEVIVLRRDGLMLIVEGIKHKREQLDAPDEELEEKFQ